MKIIIVGCGKIGVSIIESLLGEGSDVVVVDSSPSVIEEVGNVYDVMTVCGNGADIETLKEAGVPKADLFVAVTHSDELNMLACFVAERMGAKHTIARIRNPEYNDKSLDFLSNLLRGALINNLNLVWILHRQVKVFIEGSYINTPRVVTISLCLLQLNKLFQVVFIERIGLAQSSVKVELIEPDRKSVV